MPGKGLGMLATCDIKAGDVLIEAPATALLTVHPDRPPPNQTNLSIHGRLALALTFPTLSPKSVGDRDLTAWKAIMPSSSSLRSSIPALWPEVLQSLLPATAHALLRSQKQKLESDVAAAKEELLPEYAHMHGMDAEDVEAQYREGWLLVNSRCFYWDYPVLGGALKGKVGVAGVKRGRNGKKKRDRNDCMAMCPVMDYFNHADDDGLKVSYHEQGFKVTADRDYAQGEELNISYGKHSNDFLLVEYGFTMTPNSSDHIPLNHHILPLLSQDQQAALKEANFLGEYLLKPAPPPSGTYTEPISSHDLVCHRTQCVIRILLLPLPRWRRFVNGLDPTEGSHEQREVDAKLLELLSEPAQEARRQMHRIGRLEVQKGDGGLTEQEWQDVVTALMRRWREISEHVDKSIQILQSLVGKI